MKTGLTSGMNPNVVKAALDKVFYQKFNLPPGPEVATQDTSDVFIQDNTDRAAVIMENFKGVGLWEETAEQEEYKGDTPRVNDKITFSVSKYTKKVNISEEFMEDEQFSVVRNMVRNMGNKGRITQQRNAMAIFRNAASSTITSDGITLLSSSHQNLHGDTIDNLIDSTFDESSLNTAITALMEQKDQAGDVVGHEAKVLLVPPALYKTAVEVTESELRSGTANNDKNVYSSKYGLKVYQSPYLGAAAGGNDNAWFLLSGEHSIMRWVRVPIETKMLSGDYQENGDSVYRGRFREVYGAISYEGIVGYHPDAS